MASIFINPFVDVGSGVKPSDGSKLFFFALDVVTPKDTFSLERADPGDEHANPVIANAAGVFAEIWIEGSYVAVLKRKDDVQIWQSQPFSSTIPNSDLAITKDTIADVQADDLSNFVGGTVETLGYYVVSDGGNNTYTVVDGISSRPVEDGGEIIYLTGGSGFLYLLGLFPDAPVRFTQFGAVNDWNGTTGTNNSPVLVKLLAFTSHLYVNIGAYLLGDSVTHTSDDILIEFENQNATSFIYNGTGIGLHFTAALNLLQSGRIRLENFFIKNSINSGLDFPSYVGQGIKFTNFHSSDCGNIEIEGFNIGIDLESCFLNTFVGLTTIRCLKGLLLSGATNGNTFIGGAHLLSSYDLRAATNNTLIGVDVEPGSTTSFTGDGNKLINCRLERVSLNVAINPWLSVGNDNVIDTLGLEVNGSSLQPAGSFLVNITGSGNKLKTKTPYIHQQGFFFSVGADDNELEIDAEWLDGVQTGNPSTFQAAIDWVVDYGFNNTLTVKTNGSATTTIGDHTQSANGTIINDVSSDVANWILTDVTAAESTIPGPLNAPLSDLSVREITLTDTTGNISNGVIATGDGSQVYSGEIWVQFPASGGVTSAQLRQVTNTGGTKLQDLKKNQWQRIYHVGLPLNTVPVGLQLLFEGSIGDKILVALPRAGAGYISAFSPYGSTSICIEGSEISGSYQPTWTTLATDPTLGNGTLTGSYYKIGKLVHVDLDLSIGSTTTFGTGNEWFFSVPSTAGKSTRGLAFYFDVSAVNAYSGICNMVAGNSTLEIWADNDGAARWGPTTPVIHATGDTLKFSFTYQEA
jgi:hypothetical protein